MDKLTLICWFAIVLIININQIDASSTSCEISCFFECMFVPSPCKTDDCPCAENESTGNSTTIDEKSSNNATESTTVSAKTNSNDTDSFSLDQLKSYMFGGSGQSTNGSTTNSAGGSFDYSQYVNQGGSTNGTGSGSSGYDYSAYNTEPATIPSNPNGGFDYSEYNTPPTTIPKNGGGSV